MYVLFIVSIIYYILRNTSLVFVLSHGNIFMYVCCMVITCSSRVWINRVRSSILPVVSLTGNMIFPCPRSRLKNWSRETGLAVPSRVAACPFSTLNLNLVIFHGIPPAFRKGIQLLYHQPPYRVSAELINKVKRLRTDGIIDCRGCAGTGSSSSSPLLGII